MTTTTRLSGLDAQNPLAFFAALGLLRVLDDEAREIGALRPTLSFEDDGRPVPCINGKWSYEELCDIVLSDAKGTRGAAALALAYDDAELVAPGHPDSAHDLKPPPALARRFLERMRNADRRSVDLAASFFSELVQDNNGSTKPTALHFTAGQQQLLDMVAELRGSMTREHLDEALLGPWRGSTPLPSLSWDASVSRIYALRASNPSKEKRGSVPGANWLAVNALPFFPVCAQRRRLVTAGVIGGWKDSRFRWPIWAAPAGLDAVRSLLRGDVTRLQRREREALGVTRVFSAGILRSDQGGYGSFSPAAVEDT